MSRLRIPLLLGCLVLASCAIKDDGTPGEDPASTVADDVVAVRQHLRIREQGPLCGNGMDEHMKFMAALLDGLTMTMGEMRLFEACEVILAKPESDQELCATFDLLGQAKGDRRRFVKHAVAALGHQNSQVRYDGVRLLGKIGSPTERVAVAGLLSDGEDFVVMGAAEALAVIGGPNELISLDAWLAGPGRKPDVEYVTESVQKSRDELAARLARQAKAETKEER